MIGIEEFKKRSNELLKKFKKRPEVLACSVLDKDGFMIASLNDDFMEDNLYYKKVLEIYTAIESLSVKGIELMDFHKKRERILIRVLVSKYFTRGFMILIRSISDRLILLTISPTLYYSRPLLTNFDKLRDELSIYFLEPENQEILNKTYELMYK